ncbi:TPA: hypothetical protein KEY88_004340, partial [Serratia marcescens]|nr:hypothetical protein [Serratia marcescens]
TADDTGAVKKTGDTMTGQLIAPSFASTPDAMPNGAGAYADQLSLQAPFFQPNWQWPVNAGGLFVPIAKGTSTRKDKGYPGAVSFGYLMPANDEHPHPTIHVKGDSNVDAAWDFNPYSGAISGKAGTFATQEWVNTAVHTNELHVGGAQMAQDGNIWGTRWDSNGGWLWDAITEQVNGRAPLDYVNGTFARMDAWNVGSLCFAMLEPQNKILDYGDTVSGGELRTGGLTGYAGPGGGNWMAVANNQQLPGTWRCLGYARNDTDSSGNRHWSTTLYVRIA